MISRPDIGDAKQKIADTLSAARRGGSNLQDLAEAYDLAQHYRLQSVTGELNHHIRDRLPGGGTQNHRVALSIAVGVLCGILTNAIIFAGRQLKR
jgi:hypothetical protein